MNKDQCYIWSITFIYTIFYSIGLSFGQKNNTEIQTIYANNDSSISFEIFVPDDSTINLNSKPVFFFFEPWANGNIPVELYKKLSQKYNISLIGFNSSRNGMNFTTSDSVFTIAYNTLIRKYNLNPSLLALVGFSGGSKVALSVSSLHPEIPFVVYGGSAIEVRLQNKNILGFAGKNDMNYVDLLNYDNNLNKQSTSKHIIIEYEGAHTWFDSITMENAFIWFKLNLMKANTILIDTTIIQLQKKIFDKKINLLIQDKNWIEAYKLNNQAIYFFTHLISTEYWLEIKKTLEKNKSLLKENKKLQEIIELEKQTKNNYFIYIFSRDSSWWKLEVEKLNEKTNLLQRSSNERLLNCLNTYCYYFTINAFSENNLISAEKILIIYRIAFPNSAEQAFLYAVLWAKKNNPEKSDIYLNEAKKLGFNEWNKSNSETILQYFIRRPLK